MKSLIGIFLIITLTVVTGCSKRNPRQAAFDDAKRQGKYQLVASANIGEDKIEFWQEAKESDDSSFGRFLMVAVEPSGDLIDFCEGTFVSSRRPFFQTSRYIALVAGIALGKEREVFFVYDSQSKKFLTHSVDEFVPDVHDNIIILGDIVFFASCKTPTPVGRLDLTTGQVNMFGTPAPQGTAFYLVGSDVLIQGTDKKIYKVDEKKLIQVDTTISENRIAEMSFDTILKNRKSEQTDPLDKK